MPRIHRNTLSPRLLGAAAPAALMATMWLPLTAQAQISDTVHPYVSVGYNYDDNLLRLPNSEIVPGQPLSDTYRNEIAGVSLERPVGLQVFSAMAQVSHVSFQHFSELDYVGKNATLNWLWRLGSHLDGNLGATYSETLASFSDFHSTERNLRTQRGTYAEGNWRFHPVWRLRTRLSSTKYDYDLASQSFLDRTEDNSEVGLDYLESTGSTIGIQANHLRGRYPNVLTLGASLLDEGYTQNEIKFKLYWKISEISQLQLLVGRAKREHELSSLRDASGVNGRATFTWTPLQRVQLIASAWQQFTPFEGSTAADSLDKGLSLSASWAATTKVSVQGQYSQVRRDFGGALLLLQQPSGTRDDTHTATVSVNYQLRNNIQLSVSAFRDLRTADQFASTSDFRASGGSANVNFQF